MTTASTTSEAWHETPAAIALLDAVAHHINATLDFPLEMEAQLEAMREASLTDAWVAWGCNDIDGFEASILSVQEALEQADERLQDRPDEPAFLGYLAEHPRLSAVL